MKTPIGFIEQQQNGVLLTDYTLKDMIWFMQKYAEYYADEMKILINLK